MNLLISGKILAISKKEFEGVITEKGQFLKEDIQLLFKSQLMYIITGSTFLIVFIIGLVLEFEPFVLLLLVIFSTYFGYIFSIILMSTWKSLFLIKSKIVFFK